MRLSGSPTSSRQIAAASSSSVYTVAHSRSSPKPKPPSRSARVSRSHAYGMAFSLKYPPNEKFPNIWKNVACLVVLPTPLAAILRVVGMEPGAVRPVRACACALAVVRARAPAGGLAVIRTRACAGALVSVRAAGPGMPLLVQGHALPDVGHESRKLPR